LISDTNIRILGLINREKIVKKTFEKVVKIEVN